MEAVKLYKYLDFTGGLMMLHYSNLQFTNATQLNDPFDCHPSLIVSPMFRKKRVEDGLRK